MYKYEEVVLQKLKAAVMENVNIAALYDPLVDGYLDTIAETMVLRLSAFVWKGEAHTIKIPVPDGWFQQWKLEKAPKWFVRKYPVKYVNKVVDVTPYFPNLRKIAKENQTELRYQVQSLDFSLNCDSK